MFVEIFALFAFFSSVPSISGAPAACQNTPYDLQAVQATVTEIKNLATLARRAMNQLQYYYLNVVQPSFESIYPALQSEIEAAFNAFTASGIEVDMPAYLAQMTAHFAAQALDVFGVVRDKRINDADFFHSIGTDLVNEVFNKVYDKIAGQMGITRAQLDTYTSGAITDVPFPERCALYVVNTLVVRQAKVLAQLDTALATVKSRI